MPFLAQRSRSITSSCGFMSEYLAEQFSLTIWKIFDADTDEGRRDGPPSRRMFRKISNNGTVPQYYVENDHEAIIPKELFVQV